MAETVPCSAWRDLELLQEVCEAQGCGQPLPVEQENAAKDVLEGRQFSLQHLGVWRFLWQLAEKGKIKAVIGGPPCRNTSWLRHSPPQPRSLRGRGDLRHVFRHYALKSVSLSRTTQGFFSSRLRFGDWQRLIGPVTTQQ